MGDHKFHHALSEAKRLTAEGRGGELAPFDWMEDYFSYQSVADILDPNGNYNTFPYYESQHGRLGTKPLWGELGSIAKPTLVVYGAADQYCYPDVPTCLEILKRNAPKGVKFTYKTIPGADHSCYQHEPELAAVIAEWVTNEEWPHQPRPTGHGQLK
jgi:pimeloyl-ACP methyl ester carboxylesterase